ncbi:MAG: hypothetical protein EZS28_029546 [Streblomastix strix]|uniref:Uncharacterized protein n=1 Tax=Streblomastix strix TaxID=222440 RepID=A0A5J4UX90_9EUKA|nr:MAG: hypothetical protein EZS28_029546 [Streblomastix strix]
MQQQPDKLTNCQFHQFRHIRNNKLLEYHCYLTQQREVKQQRQSNCSISPTLKRTEESEEDDFLNNIILGITMPHLPPHKTDLETTQRTWQN